MTTQRKLNIAMVCDPIAAYKAGSYISALRQSELLDAKKHKVIFIAAKSPKAREDNHHNNIKIYRFASMMLPKSESKVYIAFPTFKALEKIFKEEKIDILHIIIPTPAALMAVRVAKKLGIKIVAHSHTQAENLFLHVPKMLFRSQISSIFNKYLVWLYGKANILIHPSEFSKNLFPKLEKIKNVIISNGVDTEKFKPIDPQPIFEKYSVPKNKKYVLFVGRLHPEKSLDTLVKAMPEILKKEQNAHALIVGQGHMDVELKKLAADLKIEKHMTFFGEVTDEELVMAYSAGDIFVLPSLAELEGMAVLEAMAFGKPIIVANSKDSASTYFVQENGFLFEPKNIHDLTDKVIKILKDEDLLNKMGKISLEKIKNYDIHESITRLEEAYYSILQE